MSVHVPWLLCRDALLTLLDKLGPLDTGLDGFLVAQLCVGAEGLVQPGAEVVVAEGVFAAEEEEFWADGQRRGRRREGIGLSV